jgi:hypothetical protein
MKILRICLFSLALTALNIPSGAATLSFLVNQDACTGTCGAAPFGTVTLTDNGTGSSAFVSVNLVLSANERFAGGGAGDALEFNVTGPVTITSITSGFGIGPSPDTASAFGTFLHSVTCTACQGGQAGNPAGPLNFNVGSATGVTVTSFIANTGGYFFAADIVGNNGNTGNVAARGPVSGVPEPSSQLLITSSGLLLAGFGLLRKRISA